MLEKGTSLMRYILCLLLLLNQAAYARLDLDSGDKKENTYADPTNIPPRSLGFFSLDIGISYFYLTNEKVRDGLKKYYGAVNLLPVVRGAYFFDLNPFAIGIGLQVSYMKKRANSFLDKNATTRSNGTEVLVYLPYQFFLDFKYSPFNSFLVLDTWVGYEEAFVQSRRSCSSACNSDGKAWISEFGKYWNSYLVIGGSVGFSLKGLTRNSARSERGFLEPKNILIKLFYEHDINLEMDKLIGGRKVTSVLDMAKGHGGLSFSFEI